MTVNHLLKVLESLRDMGHGELPILHIDRNMEYGYSLSISTVPFTISSDESTFYAGVCREFDKNDEYIPLYLR